jgi:hypothetical protein
MKSRGKEYMVRMTVFNTNSILSVTTSRRIISATVILFVLQCIGSKDAYIFAEIAEKEQGRVHDEKSDHPQTKPIEGLPSVEPPAQPEPELIRETVEPVLISWESTKGFGEKIDWIHANLYKTVQDQVERFDYWFKPPQGEQRIVELSRFRVGVFGEVEIKDDEGVDVKQVLDFDTDIELPNMKRRMKIIITTNDPTTLPGKDVIEQRDKSLRAAAVAEEWMRDLSVAIGVRARWKPGLFVNAVWSPTWKTENWLVYPQQKIYWENEIGLGEISTLVFDHWTNRWNTRFSTSIKWSEQDRDNDHQTERKDEGFRWSEVFIFGHAKELMDEMQLGRVVAGEDVAHGWGIRLAAFGGFHLVDEYRAGIFYRRPLRKKWMYLLVEPEINWRNENNWNHEWKIKFGIEMLFWGKKER